MASWHDSRPDSCLLGGVETENVDVEMLHGNHVQFESKAQDAHGNVDEQGKEPGT